MNTTQYLLDLGSSINVVTVDEGRNCFDAFLVLPSSHEKAEIRFHGDLKFHGYRTREDKSKLLSIHSLDLMGNGACTNFQGRGYGTAIVSTTLRQLTEHFADQMEKRVSIVGELSNVDDPDPMPKQGDPLNKYEQGRLRFWKKMGFKAEDEDSRYSKISAVLQDIPSLVNILSATKLSETVKTDPQAIDALPWTEYDELLLQEIRRNATLPSETTMEFLKQNMDANERNLHRILKVTPASLAALTAWACIATGFDYLTTIPTAIILAAIVYVGSPYIIISKWHARSKIKAASRDFYNENDKLHQIKRETVEKLSDLDRARFGVVGRASKLGKVGKITERLLRNGALADFIECGEDLDELVNAINH